MKKLFSLLTLALLTLSVGATTVTDVITAADLAATGTTYTDFSGVQKNTAVYAGQSALNNDANIQLRSKNSNSGIVSTTSGGKLVSVKITVASGSNTIDVYGSNTAYTAASDLYASGTQGTKVGSTSETATITVDGDYEYVGIRSNNGAVYISSIEVTWETGDAPIQDKVAAPTFTPYNAEGYHFTGSLAVTVSCATENAQIALYKVVDGEIDYSTYQYIFQSGVVYVTENTTYAAMASKGGYDDSDYAYATYVLDNDNPEPQTPEYITFVGGDFTSTTGAFSIAKSGVTIACSNGLIGTDQIRFYKNSQFSFTSTAGNITKIEFTCTANNDDQYGPGCVTLNEGEAGTYSYDAKVGTWTGSATSVNFTATANQMRTTEIRVWIDGEIVVTVAAPTFDPEDGTTFTTESLDVTITGPAGSTIHYIVGDNDEEEGETPVTVTLTETTTIMAYAEIDGVESDLVEATYTKEETPVYEPWEGTEAYLSNRDKGDFSGNSAREYTISKEERPGISFTVSNGMAADNGYRIYKSQTITFNSLVGNITMIQFIGVEGNPVSNFGEVEGMTYDGNNGTWIGDAATVTFTASVAQVRATEIRVTVGERPAILYAPVIAPETNTVFAGSQQVTITCATEGAEVYYIIDEGEATLYEGPFTIDASCTVKAYSVLDEQTSATVTANYHLGTVIDNIAAGNVENSYYIYNGEAVVTYQDLNNGGNTWIRDNNGNSIVIYGYQVPAMEQGDMINAGWTANYIVYNNVPEFRYPMGIVKGENKAEVEPYVRESVTEANVNEYVVMKGISLLADTANTKKFYNAADSLVVYNQFNLADSVLNIEEGKLYDVEGIVSIFNKTTLELYITKVTEHVAAEWQVGDVNHDGFVNVGDVTALIQFVLGNTPEVFFVEQAQINGDTDYNVADVTALIQIVLNGN